MSGSPIDPFKKTLGNASSTGGGLDPKDIGLDVSNLSTETFDKIQQIIQSANAMMTETEKKQKEIQQNKLYEYQNKLTSAIEKEAMKEKFMIPKDNGKLYKFIGYSMEQFEEIFDLANQYDNYPSEEKGSKKHLQMQTDVWKKTIKYSLEGITDEVIDTIPKQQMNWLYLVLKEKNENPLPFDLSV
jgi:hypothetical protein